MTCAGITWARSMAWRKNASALAVSRWSRSNTSTTTPPPSIARYVPLLARAKHEDLVHEPVSTDATMASDLSGEQGPKHLGAHQDGAVRDIDAPLGQQLADLPARQWVRKVPAHRCQR